jgi:hypothetical protein
VVQSAVDVVTHAGYSLEDIIHMRSDELAVGENESLVKEVLREMALAAHKKLEKMAKPDQDKKLKRFLKM